ncbi:MAG: hypothetical protein RLO80_12695 [Hyphomonas sp.]
MSLRLFVAASFCLGLPLAAMAQAMPTVKPGGTLDGELTSSDEPISTGYFTDCFVVDAYPYSGKRRPTDKYLVIATSPTFMPVLYFYSGADGCDGAPADYTHFSSRDRTAESETFRTEGWQSVQDGAFSVRILPDQRNSSAPSELGAYQIRVEKRNPNMYDSNWEIRD